VVFRADADFAKPELYEALKNGALSRTRSITGCRTLLEGDAGRDNREGNSPSCQRQPECDLTELTTRPVGKPT
jgi:hypothetical protein